MAVWKAVSLPLSGIATALQNLAAVRTVQGRAIPLFRLTGFPAMRRETANRNKKPPMEQLRHRRLVLQINA
jgi:hypothetical protein